MAKMCFSLLFSVLVALYIGSNPVEASLVDGGEILFTTQEEKYEMPESCAGQTYCFNMSANYPKYKIEELLKDVRELNVEIPKPRTNIDSRNGDAHDEPDWLSKSTESPIYYIVDENDKVRVVVQLPKKYQQVYRVKWCRDEGRISILRKFNIQCVSSKMDLDFFVLRDDTVNRKPKMEIASAKGGIPMSCRCRRISQ